MKIRSIVIVLILMALPLTLFSAITAIPNATTFTVYDLLEVTINSDFGAKNPYDYGEINVQASFKTPEGRTLMADGFYMREFDYSYDSNNYTEKAGCFKVRYTPSKAGNWKYSIRAVKNGKEVFRSEEKKFTVAKNPARRGFLKVSKNDPLFLEFDNKESFFGIGQNLAWSAQNDLLDYRKWMGKMRDNGANMARIWMAAWGLGIEWDTQMGDYGPRQKRAFMLDEILRLAKADDIYIMLTLISHGEYTSKINPEWDRNPYNSKNEGVLDSPEQFFTNQAARAAFKNRMRYIMARWGFSQNIMAWELFNEVDLTENYNSTAVAEWHSDIFDFIKSRDSYKHLLTTSFSNPNKDPEVWNLSQIDIVQTHMYGMKDEAGQIYEASKNKLDTYARPHIFGEFGVGSDDQWIKDNKDPNGVSIHNAIWAGAFTLSCAAPMPWYWDNYIEPKDIYTVYKPLREFVKNLKWDKESFYDLQSRDVFFKKVPAGSKGGDAVLYPVDAWEKASKTEFMLKPDGTFTNKNGFISFLYGAGHPEMKTNPIISFENEMPIKMVVKVNKISAKNELAISINKQPALSVELNAEDFDTKKYLAEYKIYQSEISREITLEIPPGDNDIMFENEGDDWIHIESIKFENYLSSSVAPVFVSGVQGKSSAYLWLKNKKYSYENQAPEPVAPSYLDIAGLPARQVCDNVL